MKVDEGIKRIMQKDIAWLYTNLEIPKGWEWTAVYDRADDYPDFQINESKLINPAEGEIIFINTSVGVTANCKYTSGRYETFTFNDPKLIEFRKIFRRPPWGESAVINKITVKESFRFPGTDIIIEKGDVIEVETQEAEKMCECGQPLMGQAEQCEACAGKKKESIEIKEDFVKDSLKKMLSVHPGKEGGKNFAISLAEALYENGDPSQQTAFSQEMEPHIIYFTKGY